MDRGVDLNLMRYLAVLLREQSVTRAAEKLDVSQPAVSAALSRLRSLLDDELMVRGPSGISLTPRARELVAHSEELERVVDRILGADATFDPKKSERCFTIQSTDFIQWLLAPRLAAGALSEAPKVTFRFLQPDPLHIENSMSAGTLDLGIGYLPACPANLLQQHIMTDHYVCLLRRTHPIFKSLPFYMYWHPRSARDKGLHWLRRAVAKILREHKAQQKVLRALSPSLK